MKKRMITVLLLIMSMLFIFACSNNQNAQKDIDYLKSSDITYMGGLTARSEVNDMMLALYKSNGEPVAIIMELGKTYYGKYITEDAKLSDGTEYTKIIVQNKTYGYHFDDEWTGIVVDQAGNKYEAKKIDESVANDMIKWAIDAN